MSFLKLTDKTVLILGVANRKSVAWQVAKILIEEGTRCLFVVKDEEVKQASAKLLSGHEVFTCDVEREEEIAALAQSLKDQNIKLDGLLHSIAFADFSHGMVPFHETPRAAFLQAMDISCFSLVAVCGALKEVFNRDASIVTVSISTTTMASENYGYMAPIKAALDGKLAFLTKSLSDASEIRVNAVAPGLLKTSASAGIPGYVDSYLYAETVIPRGRAVTTEEAASSAVFLLSPRSSGITAQKLVVDAGMSINYFDKEVIRRVVE